MYLYHKVSFRQLSDFLKHFMHELAVSVLIKGSVPVIRRIINPCHRGVTCMQDAPCWSARCFSNTPPLLSISHALMMTLGPLLITICIALLTIIPLLCTILTLKAWDGFLWLTATYTQSFGATSFFPPLTIYDAFKGNDGKFDFSSTYYLCCIMQGKPTTTEFDSLTEAKLRLLIQDFKNVTHSHSYETAWTLWPKIKQRKYDRHNFRNWEPESKLNDMLSPDWNHSTKLTLQYHTKIYTYMVCPISNCCFCKQEQHILCCNQQ